MDPYEQYGPGLQSLAPPVIVKVWIRQSLASSEDGLRSELLFVYSLSTSISR